MTDTLNLEEYHTLFYFGFLNNGANVDVDPRIGSFKLYQQNIWLSEFGPELENFDVGVTLVDFNTDEQARIHFPYQGSPKGIYKPADISKLELSQNVNTLKSVAIQFVYCSNENRNDCASSNEIEEFLAKNTFTI